MLAIPDQFDVQRDSLAEQSVLGAGREDVILACGTPGLILEAEFVVAGLHAEVVQFMLVVVDVVYHAVIVSGQLQPFGEAVLGSQLEADLIRGRPKHVLYGAAREGVESGVDVLLAAL